MVPPRARIRQRDAQSIGAYLQNIVRLSFSTLPYQGVQGEEWLAGWTTYYWGWWMSWSPFVGIFIARISRGRTVREFIIGVLLVPTLVTFLWFSVMGGTALYRQLFGDGGLITGEGQVDTRHCSRCSRASRAARCSPVIQRMSRFHRRPTVGSAGA
ncbi:BCCT family transporter [Georgenia sp. SUBG003]|uniref:BCCT family transporter n=1 Tax=Georgenia sp. SUBG003 TaxID=1497974 RepID=UPI003AB51A2F